MKPSLLYVLSILLMPLWLLQCGHTGGLVRKARVGDCSEITTKYNDILAQRLPEDANPGIKQKRADPSGRFHFDHGTASCDEVNYEERAREGAQMKIFEYYTRIKVSEYMKASGIHFKKGQVDSLVAKRVEEIKKRGEGDISRFETAYELDACECLEKYVVVLFVDDQKYRQWLKEIEQEERQGSEKALKYCRGYIAEADDAIDPTVKFERLGLALKTAKSVPRSEVERELLENEVKQKLKTLGEKLRHIMKMGEAIPDRLPYGILLPPIQLSVRTEPFAPVEFWADGSTQVRLSNPANRTYADNHIPVQADSAGVAICFLTQVKSIGHNVIKAAVVVDTLKSPEISFEFDSYHEIVEGNIEEQMSGDNVDHGGESRDLRNLQDRPSDNASLRAVADKAAAYYVKRAKDSKDPAAKRGFFFSALAAAQMAYGSRAYDQETLEAGIESAKYFGRQNWETIFETALGRLKQE